MSDDQRQAAYEAGFILGANDFQKRAGMLSDAASSLGSIGGGLAPAAQAPVMGGLGGAGLAGILSLLTGKKKTPMWQHLLAALGGGALGAGGGMMYNQLGQGAEAAPAAAALPPNLSGLPAGILEDGPVQQEAPPVAEAPPATLDPPAAAAPPAEKADKPAGDKPKDETARAENPHNQDNNDPG